MNGSVHEAMVVLTNCLGLREGEELVIVTEQQLLEQAIMFAKASERLYANPSVIVLSELATRMRDMPQTVISAMERSSAVLLILSENLIQLFGHTESKRRVIDSGSRFAALVGSLKDIPNDIDLKLMRRRAERFANIFNEGGEVRIFTEGAEAKLSIEGRKGMFITPIVNRAGSWGAIPHHCEAFIAPVEGTAEGRLIVDTSIIGYGLVDEPVEITIKDGLIVNIRGGKAADWLSQKILNTYDPLVRNVAEVAVGLNHMLKNAKGWFLDKSICGSGHIGIGDNATIGGRVKSPIHIDVVFKNFSLEVDGKRVIDGGKMTVENGC
jgi:leucyl aminopeptidase (aminopeptidase T)